MVVELSRNETCEHILIVGEMHFAIERMYETLCIATQWTALMETLVENLSVTGDGTRGATRGLVDVANFFPWRIKDISLPMSNSGFVYLLISTRCPEQTYVGTTQNISVRLNEHNSGFGAEGTSCADYIPWFPAAYITNMAHLTKSERMGLESQWQSYNRHSVARGNGHIEVLIENGNRVAKRYNDTLEGRADLHLNIVVCVQRRFPLGEGEV